jgi:hypothetical protein
MHYPQLPQLFKWQQFTKFMLHKIALGTFFAKLLYLSEKLPLMADFVGFAFTKKPIKEIKTGPSG